MHVEKSRQPTGETQTLEPRPRPAVCSDASAVKPVGRASSSLWFLSAGGKLPLEYGGVAVSLCQNRVGALHHLAI